jgi:glycerol uptake facilitator-like aquaporin
MQITQITPVSMKSTLVRNYDAESATLNGQMTHMTQVRRSYMYEFIMLFILSAIVLGITVRNMTSSTVTTGGYIICCIIIVLFVSAVIVFGVHYMNNDNNDNDALADKSGGGPVIRIQYV